MMIMVRVVPNSRSESVHETAANEFRVKVRAKAMDGKANAAVIVLLSAHFRVRESRIKIVRGAGGREKTIEVT